jgi:outer membrane protein, multidrug efflux system
VAPPEQETKVSMNKTKTAKASGKERSSAFGQKGGGAPKSASKASLSRAVTLSVLGLALSACVNSDDIRTGHGIALPLQYASTEVRHSGEGSASEDKVVLEGWLSDFESQKLDGLVFEALSNNKDLQVAAARVEEARALAWIRTGAMLPSVSVSGSKARSRVNIPTGLGGKTKALGDSYGANLDLSWELDLWGKLNNRRRAAAADYKAQRATYTAAQLSLSGRVVRAWFGLVEAEEQLRLAEETEASFTRAERMVRGRYEQGLRRALDVRLAASNAASARALSASRREQVRNASTTLEVLLGRYPTGALSGDGVLPILSPKTTNELPSALLSRRPDLSAVHAQAVAAELRRSAALKDLLPSLRLNASGGYQDDSLADLEDPANLIWSLAGGLIQPLFQGGALKAQADAAAARGDQALARYSQSLLNAFQEVEMVLYSEGTLAVREENLAEAALQAVAAEKSASDLFSRGLTGIFDLLETQRRSLNAQSSYLDVRRRRLSNRVTLYIALGGEIPSSPNDPASPDGEALALLTPVD